MSRPVKAKDVQTQHQIYLVDLKDLQVDHDGRCFRCILSLIDVFSENQLLKPLERKKNKPYCTSIEKNLN